LEIDHNKLRELIARDVPPPSPDELRREQDVFFVGGNLPERQTLETLFESHYQSHAALFHLTFGGPEDFHKGESLARVIKKNFHVHLVGRLDFPAPVHLVERAYAAGVDIIDIPLTAFDPARLREAGYGLRERLGTLEAARSVFPRWSVVSTLRGGEEAPASTLAGIETLLAAEVVPLVTLSGQAARHSEQELSGVFAQLAASWRAKKAVIKPLLPLIYLSTPFVPSPSRWPLSGFVDLIDGRRLLATSDLRRVLRVKEVEESYSSSGL